MGYCIVVNADIRIDVRKEEEIIKAVEEVYKGLSCDSPKAKNLEELFTELGYDDGDYSNVDGVEIYEMGCFCGEKLHEENSYWPKIIGMCMEGSYIEFDGEDECSWRFRQETNGVEEDKCYPPLTQEPLCPCCGSKDIKTQKKDSSRKEVSGLCKTCKSTWEAVVHWTDIKILEDNNKKVSLKVKEIREVLSTLQFRQNAAETTAVYEEIITRAENQLKELLK